VKAVSQKVKKAALEPFQQQNLPVQFVYGRSAAISRKLRILRAHGLIQKVPKTHRYQVTSNGRLAITAVLTMDRTSIARRRFSFIGQSIWSMGWHRCTFVHLAKMQTVLDFSAPDRGKI